MWQPFPLFVRILIGWLEGGGGTGQNPPAPPPEEESDNRGWLDPNG